MSPQTPSHPPSVAFAPDAPGYVLDPYPALEELRTKAPLYYWPEGRSWLLSRYEDATAVLRDSKRFSPNRDEWEFAAVAGSAALIPELAELNKGGLFALSGSDHARVRKLVSPALTPRAIERLRPELQAIVDDILNDLKGRNTINVVTDISDRIPPRVIGSMLKIPKGRETLFQRFTEAAIKSFLPGLLRPEEVPSLRADVQEGIALVRETIEERRRNPLPDDILTTLIQTEEQGDRLNTSELLSLVAALIVGGFETTVHLIGFTVYNVLKRPELLAQVKSEPELLKGVIEEVLRFDNFGKLGIARYALEDVEMGGVTIKKGQMVLVLLNSALRDENVFPKADVFDVRRNTNSSIAFGHGMHFCLGASLARLEVQIAVETFIKRYPALRLAKEPSFGPHPVIRKMESLEVQLNQQ
ncbi:cytochrome [Archangium sp. Cb G35]|uniref:cytochrome P450 n=1 Tax=Archangium sp. Cb G35 TaxID=1920190 RepID=UPI0009359EE6|nr:cytochrome P450 [Archangium sp. Cb G35]OJT26612.1 cytochrome [Archangium sp. Cb G35]